MKDPPRKRRKKDEIKRGTGDFKCEYCTKILTRKQTLQEHIHKFHPLHSFEIHKVSRKGKGKGKKSAVSSTILPDTGTFSSNQQFGQQGNCFYIQVYFFR